MKVKRWSCNVCIVRGTNRWPELAWIVEFMSYCPNYQRLRPNFCVLCITDGTLRLVATLTKKITWRSGRQMRRKELKQGGRLKWISILPDSDVILPVYMLFYFLTTLESVPRQHHPASVHRMAPRRNTVPWYRSTLMPIPWRCRACWSTFCSQLKMWRIFMATMKTRKF